MSAAENDRRPRWKSIALFAGVEAVVVLGILAAGVIGTDEGHEVAWVGLTFAIVIGFMATAPLTAAMVFARGQRLARATAGVLAGAVGFFWALIVGITAQSDWSIH